VAHSFAALQALDIVDNSGPGKWVADAQSVKFLATDSAFVTPPTEPIAPSSPCAFKYRLKGSIVVAHTVVTKPTAQLCTECLVLLFYRLVHILLAPSPQRPHEVGETPARTLLLYHPITPVRPGPVEGEP
jgi:hypothetical protein